MSLDLGSLFRQQSNITNANAQAGKNVTQANTVQTASAQKGAMPQVGSVVSGQVVEVKDGSLTLQTDNGRLITAKTEEGTSFVKGSYLSFEVSGVSESQISLKALFTNTAAGSSTMSGALLQAGISENASSFGMVRAMMENGMPIDKGSLVSMYRQVTSHPDTMSGNKNINQFEAYKNLEHQINQTVSDVSASMSEAMDELFASGDDRAALEFIKNTANVLTESPADADTDPVMLQDTEVSNTKVIISEDGGKSAAQNGAVSDNAALQEPGIAGKDALTDNAFLKLVDGLMEEEGKTIPAEDGEKGVTVKEDPMQAFLDALNKARDGGEEAVTAKGMTGNSTDIKTDSLPDTDKLKADLSALTKDLLPDQALKEIAKGIEKLLSEPQTPETQGRLAKAMQLLQGKDLKDLLSDNLSKQWRMEPSAVSSKDEVQDFYAKLRSQTQRLSETVKESLGTENRLFEQVTNIRQNVDFMNQLNQTAAYVQLPLKLGGEDAHGDLYVYTNKKSLADNNGKVSAFLHLDMDNLGPVDVYVAMEHENVSTNFYLSNDEMIDFISENIHILNDRLADLGYDMSCKVSMKEKNKPSNVMEEIIADNRDGFLIGSKSFDVRA